MTPKDKCSVDSVGIKYLNIFLITSEWRTPFKMVPSVEFNFDELLSQIGSFGPFQIRVFILVSAFEAPAAWMLLQHVFAAARPSWVCPSADRGGNSTSAGGAWTMSMPAENSTGCTPYGSVCPGRVYTSDYTSIVTEVSSLIFRV